MAKHRDSVRAAALALSMASTIAAQTHTHGDAVGSLTPNSAVVWTRASTNALVWVRYATNPALGGALQTAAVSVTAATDFTVKVLLSGLQPGTSYWYSTVLANPGNPSQFVSGSIGSFTTPPPPGAAARVRFVATADISDHVEYDVFARMATHAPQFFACLGDFPYADGANSLADYRAKHAEVRNEARLQAFLRRVPLIASWDDHEVVNNWDATTNVANVQNGTAAWREWLPVSPSSGEIYRSLRWGAGLEYFVLDTRLHRGANAAPDLPGKEMLGAAQLAWLKGALRSSTAAFKVIGTSVPLRFGTTGSDHWQGYMRERRELFDFVSSEGIEGVVFLSADQHWAASYGHHEGFREFQVGPAARGVRTSQSTNDPQQRWVAEVRNYALITVDPSASPATLTVDWHDPAGALLRREVVEAGARAHMTLTSDEPEARFDVGGRFAVAGGGGAATISHLEAGGYTARFAPLAGADGVPSDLDLSIPPGAVVRVGADHRDAWIGPHRLLLSDDFEGALNGYTVVDEGMISGPSAWFTDGGHLVQNSNIHTISSWVEFPGTIAVTGDPSWTDYTMRLRLKSLDNDSIGAVFRYRGAGDYYRFSMDAQRGFRRLVSRRGGSYRVLAEDAVGYAPYHWIDLEVVVVGNRIVVTQDGSVVFDVTDSDHGTGRVGLYCWGNMASLYDSLIVREGDARPTSLFADDFDDGVLTGWTVYDQVSGQTSNWLESAGTLQQTSNINDGDSDPASVPKLGTMAIGSYSGADYTMSAAFANTDDDALGVVVRFVDPNNYYRFSADSQRTYRRLAVVANGSWTTLWEDMGRGYSTGAWHTVQVRCAGSELEVWFDGAFLARVSDSTHAAGAAGFYCWGSDGARFDDFAIAPALPRRAALASIGVGSTTTLVGRAAASPGLAYQFMMSGARSPGIALNLAFAGDPRVLELAPDPLFFATALGPSFPGFVGVLDPGGNAAGTIVWPPIPALSGTVLYCGGWVLGAGTIPELWPTVEVLWP